jgi:hypothetical protein
VTVIYDDEPIVVDFAKDVHSQSFAISVKAVAVFFSKYIVLA